MPTYLRTRRRLLPSRLSTINPHVLVAACVRGLVLQLLDLRHHRLAVLQIPQQSVAYDVPDVVELGPEEDSPAIKILVYNMYVRELQAARSIVHADVRSARTPTQHTNTYVRA